MVSEKDRRNAYVRLGKSTNAGDSKITPTRACASERQQFQGCALNVGVSGCYDFDIFVTDSRQIKCGFLEGTSFLRDG